MANGINRVTLLGNLGQDPVLRLTTSGRPVCNFTLATDETWTDAQGTTQKRTEWHRIVVWGKAAEACAKFLKKGSAVMIDNAKLRTRRWETESGEARYVTEVHTSAVQFLPSSRVQQQQTVAPEATLDEAVELDEAAKQVLEELAQ